MEQIGMNIRAVRKACGLTLQQLALGAGYDAGNLSKLERGLIDWSGQSLRAIADAMGVPLKFFFLTPSEIRILNLWSSLGDGERAVIARMAGDHHAVIDHQEIPIPADRPESKAVPGPTEQRQTIYHRPQSGKVIRLNARYLPPKAAGGSR